MANYKETNLSGTSWVRCCNINITNPSREVNTSNKAVAVFQEEKLINIDGTSSILPYGNCVKYFDPTNGIIPLRNPYTGELTGTNIPHAELYVILYSLYLQTAEERDATQVAQA